jgi:hypothetical protein
MRKFFVATAASLLLLSSAAAEPMFGKKLMVGPDGSPFCTELENLREYIVAAMTNDVHGIKALHKDKLCFMLKHGIPISVLEDLGDTDSDLHGLKVRAIIPTTSTSLVGYTLTVGMRERK